MRGERPRAFNSCQISAGSSPHARGTHPRMPRRPTRSPVHPRMRGERNVRNLVGRHVHGSSPHARGTLTSVPANGRNTRFIPACAGNAQSRTGGERESSVHPRMRGERQWMHAAALALDGSSPHARGTPSRRLPGVLLGRFIPACAGNALCAEVVHRLRPVHPRMRGERTAWMHPSIDITGSSPHARGTLGENKGDPVEIRFIPACAGNAREQCRRGRLRSVHPRMRGERTQHAAEYGTIIGSSPHARGTLPLSVVECLVGRFIPACAGNACHSVTTVCRFTVHPRMRGERTSNKLLIYRRKSEPSDSTKHSGC